MFQGGVLYFCVKRICKMRRLILEAEIKKDHVRFLGTEITEILEKEYSI